MSERGTCPTCGQALPDTDDIFIDYDAGLVVYRDLMAHLPRSQFEIFAQLYDGRPRVLSKQALFDGLYWRKSSDEEPIEKIIDVFIHKIRRQLRAMPFEIVTAWGKGYCFRPRKQEGEAA